MANDLPPGSMSPPVSGGTPPGPGVNPPPPPGVNPPPPTGPGTPPSGPGTVIVGPGPPPPTSNTPPSAATDVDAAANSVVEGAAVNALVGVTARSTDAQGQTIVYSLASDSSGGGFKIDAATGVVTVANPAKINFETAAGHAYTITVNSYDGFSTSSQSFTINVSDIAPSTPVDGNAGANTVAEGAAANTLVGITASSADVNGPGVTYSLSNSANGAFKIDPVTGVVSVADPSKIDFESTAPGHALTITVVASDGTLTSSQNFVINISDVALAAPIDGNGTANTIAEGAANGSTVGFTAFAADPNGPATIYSLTDSAGGRFAINSTTGVVTVANGAAIDFETSGGSYNVTVQAANGVSTTTQSFAIGVTDVAPSTPNDTNGAADTVLEGVANGTAVGITAASFDPNGPATTFSLTDSAGGRFTIDANTGIVTVANGAAIDFETAPGNAYGITVQATSGALSSTQTFSIGVGNVNEAPAGTDKAVSIAEDNPYVFSVADFGFSDPGDSAAPNALLAVTMTTVPGAGAGTLTNNGVTVNAGDSVSVAAIAAGLLVYTPVLDSNGSPLATFTFQVQDNGGTANGGVDTDQSANTITFDVTSVNDAPAGTDKTIGSIGAHTFAAADFGFTDPVDAANAGGANALQAVIITTIPAAGTGTLDLNGVAVTAGQSIAVADIGGLVFTPVGNNPGTFTFQVQDNGGGANGGVDTDQSPNSLTVIQNVAPIIDSDGGGATFANSIAENTTAVTIVHATDPDAGPSPITYSIVPGNDGAKFSIVASGAGAGTLAFISAPDFENPTDTGDTAGNNTYVVTVRAFDGTSFDDQTVTVTVTNANDAPVITSNGSAAVASIDVNENVATVFDFNATDQDLPAQTLTWSLAGGVDQARFTIDPTTGILSFQSPQNFEAPTDANVDNAYDVTIRVTDNGTGNLIDEQAVTVNVKDVNEAPATNAIIATGNEDPTGPAYIPITITGTDVDAGDSVASFHITGLPGGAQGLLYSDAGLTTIVTDGADVAASGNAATLYFVPAANFNGAVTFNAAATDTHNVTDATSAIETINVNAINDAPANDGVPASFTVGAGFSHTVTGLSISDIDAGSANDITTTFTAGTGTMSIGNGTSGGTAGIAGGATVSTNGTGTVLLTGTTAQINISLSGSNVVYTAGDSAANTTTTLQIATNDQGHTGAPGAIIDTDTINIGVIPQVWFINTDQSSLDATATRGSQANPFSTVAEFNAASLAATGPGANDYIYVKAGTYSGDGINLKAGQTLLGDDQALSFANPLGGPAIVIEDATGARPTINVTTASDQGIALSSGNTVAGIVVTTTAASQIGIDDSGASVGTLNISDTDVTGSGQAINLTHGGTGGTVALGTVSSTGGATGIALGGGLATNFSATSGTLSGHSTSEISISGGSANISYGGTIGDGTGLSASIVNKTGGTVTLSGNINDGADTGGGIGISGNANTTINFTGAAKTLNTGIGDGVSMTSNTGTSNVNFTGGGLDIDTTNGTGFSGSVAGTYSVTGSGNSISTTGSGTALLLNGVTAGTGGITFASASTTNAANGIVIDTVGQAAGSAGIDINGGSIANATARGVDINATSADVSIAASISDTGATARTVEVTDSGSAAAGGNQIVFSGAIDENSLGIRLDNNDAGNGATITFSGNLDIDSTTNTGFNATNGGTVNLTGSNNSITTTTGTALNVVNTNIGAGDLNFHDISVNGASNAININNTGAAGGLHITGTGTTDGSGGTIQNISGNGVQLINTADVSIKNVNLTNANTGDGTSLDLDISNARGAVYMSGVATAVLDNVNINGTADNGITGLNVSNFTLANSTITQAGNDANESGIEFSNLSGTSAITNSDISFSETNSVDIVNTDVSLNLTVTGSTFRDTQTVSSGGATNGNGEGGIQFRNFSSAAGSPTANIIIDNSQFLRLRTQGIQIIGEDDTTTNVDITDSTIDSGADIGTGIDINGNDTATVNFNIFRDIIHSRGGAGVNITSFLDSTVQGRVQNNSDITVSGTGAGGSGVRAVAQETSQLTILVANNNITAAAGNNSTPIDLVARFQNARLDVTLDNNNIKADPTALADINLQSGSSAAGETNQIFANIRNNDVLAGGPTNILRLRVSDLDGTSDPRIFLTGFVEGGAGIEDDAVATWNANANTPPMTAASVNVSLTGTAVAPSAGTALTPTNALPSTLRAAPGGVAGSSAGDNDLTQAELAPIVSAAIARWKQAGASDAQLAAISFTVADLAGNMIGDHTPGHIVIDTDAAGHGWFVDATPGDNFEFARTENAAGTDLSADPASAAAGHLDLLTAVMHEMGHELGLPDLAAAADANNLMYMHLVDGERRLPDAIDVALAPTTSLTPTISLGPVTPSGNPGNDTIDARHGGGFLFGGGGADNFVFANTDVLASRPPVSVTHVTDYSFSEGDRFDFSALTSQFHATGFTDGMIVRAVEDGSGQFATLQVNGNDPYGPPAAANWVSVAQIDGAHAGDAVNVLIDSHSGVHLAQLHVGLLV